MMPRDIIDVGGLAFRLPHEPEMERKVLSALLVNANWQDLPPNLSADSFVLAEHVSIFRLGLAEHRAGRPADGAAILARCNTEDARACIKALMALQGQSNYVRGCAMTLVDLQARRDTVELGRQIEALGLDDLRPGETAAGNLARAVEQAQDLRSRFAVDDEPGFPYFTLATAEPQLSDL